ncbi:MAG: PIN domain-containing protein [Gaiellaceae bacterium]
MSRLPRAILDSNVIFSRVLHELFGRVAGSLRLLDLIWSEELLAEAERVLIERKPLKPEQAARWVAYLRDAFPQGRVDPANVELDLSALSDDPGDEHVCALALAGQASYLFSFDRGYLRDALAARGVQVLTPDVFLTQAIEEEPAAFGTLLEEQAAVWGGGRPIDELLAAFERANVPVFAGKARALFAL